MQYEGIILEMMSRIQTLERKNQELDARITQLEHTADCSEPDGEVDISDRSEHEPHERARGKMTAEIVDACYQCARRLEQDNRLRFMDEINALVQQFGMNQNSAIMYVYAVRSMLNGEIYKRGISLPATERLFQTIKRDFGQAGLDRALRATREHIAYRHELGHTVDGLEQLCEEYEHNVH